MHVCLDVLCSVSTIEGLSEVGLRLRLGLGLGLGLGPGTEEPLIGLLVTIAIGIEATGGVVLAGLGTPLRRGLYPHQVVIVEAAVASGRVVQGPPLWADEGVGPVWSHK